MGIDSPRPKAPVPLFDEIPALMKGINNWLCWRYEWRDGKPGKPGKWTKIPINSRTGDYAKSNDPQTWDSFEAARKFFEAGEVDGIGFVLGDGIAGVDLDGVVENGLLEPVALEVLEHFNSYSEFSPSGKGIHIFALGKLKKNREGHPVALFSCLKFFTVTGRRVPYTPLGVAEDQKAFDWALAKFFPAKESKPKEPPKPASPEDEEIVTRAMRDSKFRRLWEGGIDGYESASEADCALCCKIAFWTGRDTGRIERIFYQSTPGKREKWTDREDYRERTIAAALEHVTEFYDWTRNEPPPTNGTGTHQEKEKKSSSLRRWKLEDAFSAAPASWLVDGVLPDAGLTVLYGEPGAGKSFIALDWAIHIAQGVAWFGREVRKGPTVYFVGEGAGGFPRRVIAAVVDRWQSVPEFCWIKDPLRLNETEDLDKFIKEIKLDPPALVIIDTLIHYAGAANENSATEISAVLQAAERARDAANCGVVIVHHPTKGDKEVIRGSGAILGAADCAIHVASVKGGCRLKCQKMKDSEPFQPISLALNRKEWAHPETGKPMDSCQVALGDPAAEEENEADALRRVEDFMRQRPGVRLTGTDVRDGAKVRHGREKVLLGRLVDRGLVRKDGFKWYFDENCTGTL